MKAFGHFILSTTLVFAYHSASFAKHHDKGAAGADAKLTDPCEKDVQTLCAGVEAGQGKIAQCLRENKDKVSNECKERWENTKQAFKELKEVCHEDYQKFCENVKPGKGSIMKCLRKNKANISTECKAEFKELREKKKEKK